MAARADHLCNRIPRFRTRARAVITIASNSRLESLIGLDELESAGQSVLISSNPALTFATLPALQQVAGTFTFANHESPGTLELPALESVGESLTVASNPGLQSLDLDALSSVPTLNISENPALTSIGGLPSLSVIDSMIIAGNTTLPQCDVDAIEARVSACTACEANDNNASCPRRSYANHYAEPRWRRTALFGRADVGQGRVGDGAEDGTALVHGEATPFLDGSVGCVGFGNERESVVTVRRIAARSAGSARAAGGVVAATVVPIARTTGAHGKRETTTRRPDLTNHC